MNAMNLPTPIALALILLLPQSVLLQSARPSIRSIDFSNFSYPSGAYDLTRSRTPRSKRHYTLRQGELKPKLDAKGRPTTTWLKLAHVDYLDVTGDGIDEAIVDIRLITGGSAMPDLVYVYSLRRGRANLLWTFETGDRADGGLKDILGENGKLVVELFGKNKVIGRNFYGGDDTKNGDCCPTMFTRTKYVWRGNRFQRFAKPDVLRLEK
jgi:hypothetical protein